MNTEYNKYNFVKNEGLHFLCTEQYYCYTEYSIHNFL